jgi:hypothetical protein
MEFPTVEGCDFDRQFLFNEMWPFLIATIKKEYHWACDHLSFLRFKRGTIEKLNNSSSTIPPIWARKWRDSTGSDVMRAYACVRGLIFFPPKTSADFAYAEGVAYVRRGVTSCVRTRAYGESIPPPPYSRIFPPENVSSFCVCRWRCVRTQGSDVMRAHACVRFAFFAFCFSFFAFCFAFFAFCFAFFAFCFAFFAFCFAFFALWPD